MSEIERAAERSPILSMTAGAPGAVCLGADGPRKSGAPHELFHFILYLEAAQKHEDISRRVLLTPRLRSARIENFARSSGMADIMSILQSSYTSAALTTPSKTPYTAVDPASYEGTWTGTYADKKDFKVTVTDVQGFRAQVKYESGSTVKYQSVLIKDSTFRVGDTKFTLTNTGTATIKNAVTDPATGSTYLDTAQATLKT
jgi:hypothetical protein